MLSLCSVYMSIYVYILSLIICYMVMSSYEGVRGRGKGYIVATPIILMFDCKGVMLK